jgi:hypothetical protein
MVKKTNHEGAEGMEYSGFSPSFLTFFAVAVHASLFLLISVRLVKTNSQGPLP